MNKHKSDVNQSVLTLVGLRGDEVMLQFVIGCDKIDEHETTADRETIEWWSIDYTSKEERKIMRVNYDDEKRPWKGCH